MFERIFDRWKKDASGALLLGVIAAASIVTATVAVSFLCAAAFVVALDRYGLVDACLAGAAVFLVATLALLEDLRDLCRPPPTGCAGARSFGAAGSIAARRSAAHPGRASDCPGDWLQAPPPDCCDRRSRFCPCFQAALRGKTPRSQSPQGRAAACTLRRQAPRRRRSPRRTSASRDGRRGEAPSRWQAANSDTEITCVNAVLAYDFGVAPRIPMLRRREGGRCRGAQRPFAF